MKPIDILLVEDSPTDALMTREALSKLCNTLHIVTDGVQALDFLHKRGRWSDERTPDLVLLDLNLPRKSGREVLSELKRDVHLRHIPVIVLTSSPDEADVLGAYALHANCYIVKPVDFNKFVKVVHCIEQFWLAVVTLPRKVPT